MIYNIDMMAVKKMLFGEEWLHFHLWKERKTLTGHWILNNKVPK